MIEFNVLITRKEEEVLKNRASSTREMENKYLRNSVYRASSTMEMENNGRSTFIEHGLHLPPPPRGGALHKSESQLPTRGAVVQQCTVQSDTVRLSAEKPGAITMSRAFFVE
jgi:hypothetical protein